MLLLMLRVNAVAVTQNYSISLKYKENQLLPREKKKFYAFVFSVILEEFFF